MMAVIPMAQRFAEWNAGLATDGFPDVVRGAADRAIRDTMGVMAAGGVHPSVRALADRLPGAPGPCSCLGRKAADAETAALINGMAAHAWDFDDTSYTGIMHGSAVILPAALALAEETAADEETLLAAFVAGSEIAYTIAEVAGHGHYFKGWWATVTFGLLGATAAAAKVLGLDVERTRNALGLAAASTAGGKAVLGTDGKPFLVGETAKRAIGFARAAGAGLSGPSGAIEGADGFLALLNDGASDVAEAETLGVRWRLIDPGLMFKTNPVCSAAHAPIEELARLLDEAGAGASDIAAIEAEIPELVHISLRYPRPKTVQQAQFSLPYALACAALHGRVRLEDLNADEIESPAKHALMEKVESAVAADLSTDDMRARYPESARLALTLADGRRLEGFCPEARGMPGRPLTDSQLAEKFERCLEFAGLSVTKADPWQSPLLDLAADVLGNPLAGNVLSPAQNYRNLG